MYTPSLPSSPSSLSSFSRFSNSSALAMYLLCPPEYTMNFRWMSDVYNGCMYMYMYRYVWFYQCDRHVCFSFHDLYLAFFSTLQLKWGEVKWSEVKWSEVKWSEWRDVFLSWIMNVSSDSTLAGRSTQAAQIRWRNSDRVLHITSYLLITYLLVHSSDGKDTNEIERSNLRRKYNTGNTY